MRPTEFGIIGSFRSSKDWTLRGFTCVVSMLALASALLSGCARTSSFLESIAEGPDTSQASNVTTYTPASPATETAGEAIRIFEGIVTKVGPSSWETADRKKPKARWTNEIPTEIIYTPYRVKVYKTYKGTPNSFVDLKSLGGKVGDDFFDFGTDGYLPDTGEHVVVFVSSMSKEKNGDYLANTAAVYVVDGDKAIYTQSPDSGSISTQELISAVSK